MIYYRKTLFGRGPKLTAVQCLSSLIWVNVQLSLTSTFLVTFC